MSFIAPVLSILTPIFIVVSMLQLTSFIKKAEIEKYGNLLKKNIVENFEEIKKDMSIRVKDEEFRKMQ